MQPSQPTPVAPSLLARYHRWLIHPRLPLVAVLLAVALSLPALAVGLQVDDWLQKIGLSPGLDIAGLAGSKQGMFAFVDADPARTDALRDLGFLPWWTTDTMRAVFYRPVAELTHKLDYVLWSDSPWLMHVHNLAWGAALVFVVSLFYRRFLGLVPAAGLAALLYAVDDAHGFPFGWIANRNSLIAGLFGVLTLLAHDRWRRNGSRVAMLLAPLLLLTGLLSAEAAIATTAYLFAYELFLVERPLRNRILALLPYGILIVVWRLLYNHFDYGAWGSGLYIDPGHQPIRFLQAMILRAPSLLLGAWGPITADLDLLFPDWFRPAVALTYALVLGVMGAFLIPLLRRDATARFFMVGMLLSVVPICATFPSDRLLGFVGIGAMGLIGQFLVSPALGKSARAFAVFLILVHGVLAPLSRPLKTYSPALIGGTIRSIAETLPTDPALAEQALIFVNSVEFVTSYAPLVLLLDGRPVPRKVLNLTGGFTTITMARVDERTIRVAREGGYFALAAEQLIVDPAMQWKPGEKIVLQGVAIEILSVTADGRPQEVAFRFDVPLEDPSLRWVALQNGKLIPFEVPIVGAPAVTIAPWYWLAGL